MYHTGRCGCGRITFSAAWEPAWAAYCHCTDCRKATGAPFALWVGFRADRLRLEGEPARHRPGARVVRSFCPTCGTPVAYEDGTIAGPPEIYLSIGLFDAPDRVRPAGHAFWRSRLPGLEIADGLPRFDTFSRARLPADGEAPHVSLSQADAE